MPPLYRELYDIFCPNQQDHVDQDLFINLLVKSSLPPQMLSQVIISSITTIFRTSYDHYVCSWFVCFYSVYDYYEYEL